MTGVFFIVTVPKEKYEKNRRKFSTFASEKGDQSSLQVPASNASDSNAAGEKDQEYNTNANDQDENIFHFTDEKLKDDKESIKTFIENESDIASVNMTRRGSVPHMVDVSETSSARYNTDASVIEETPTEQILKEVLKNLNICDAAWSNSSEDTHWQVSFSVSGRIRSEQTLKALRGAGLGIKDSTTLCVLPCALRYHSPTNPIVSKTSGEKDKEDTAKQTVWSNFVQSVRARQTVAQVVEQIKSQTELTFDFIFLLVVAALVAAIGLVENSTVFLVASMLISPLMGPIMASTFGTAIRDKDLLKMGVMHELFGLFLALVIGFLFGVVICSIDENYGEGEWPTYEITSRCDLRSLWVGALIAIPSGAAVAIAVLSDNTASLVGVAISASLLPPAVNAGLLWAMALIHYIFRDDDTMFTTVVKTQIYSHDPAKELAINGFISLCLTLVNIVCIYIAGILVYMIKEVAPVNSNDEQFWKHGIKAVRNYNKAAPEENKSPIENPDIEENISEDSDRENDFAEYNLDMRHCGLFDHYRYPANSHSTWSPHILSRRVSAKEIHGYYRQSSEDPKARKQRLSFPVNQLPGYRKLNEGYPSSVPTIMTRPKRKSSKFTVTPVDDVQFSYH